MRARCCCHQLHQPYTRHNEGKEESFPEAAEALSFGPAADYLTTKLARLRRRNYEVTLQLWYLQAVWSKFACCHQQHQPYAMNYADKEENSQEHQL